jgi:hypothetical protein
MYEESSIARYCCIPQNCGITRQLAG